MPQKQEVSSAIVPPLAQAKSETLEKHGHIRIDPYYWLNQRYNPCLLYTSPSPRD